MIYDNIKSGKFLSRPNRFIAHVEIDGKVEICHVKNTGRCRELLVPGAAVFVQEFDSAKRTTKYDLISVRKGGRLINMDSQAPNKVFREWLQNTDMFGNITLIRPEYSYRSSRFDFYIEADGKKILAEVKGVTLEESGIVMFPDAPTERGLKHLTELCESIEDGYSACMAFIIQMDNVLYFTPNNETHKAFGETLKRARALGVRIMAIDCHVTDNSITAKNFVDVRLTPFKDEDKKSVQAFA